MFKFHFQTCITLQINISYYPNGNIKYKDRIGNYTYDGDKLNAVDQTTNPSGDFSLEPQHIDYTFFNKVSKITEGNYELNITYGPDQQRKQSILKYTATGVEKRNIIYSGNYEKIKADDGNTYEVIYLPAGAINVRTNGSNDQLFYVFTDNLGSFNTITDANGNKVFEQNFDAWGQKRDPVDWSYPDNSQTKPPWLIRGFTGHEHLDEFSLINMNGRVYDPLLGRMLSPDNFLQNATGTQGYNRYCYARNNPLKYTDPTGESESNTQGGWGELDLDGIFLSWTPDFQAKAIQFQYEMSQLRNFVATPKFFPNGSGNNSWEESNQPSYKMDQDYEYALAREYQKNFEQEPDYYTILHIKGTYQNDEYTLEDYPRIRSYEITGIETIEVPGEINLQTGQIPLNNYLHNNLQAISPTTGNQTLLIPTRFVGVSARPTGGGGVQYRDINGNITPNRALAVSQDVFTSAKWEYTISPAMVPRTGDPNRYYFSIPVMGTGGVTYQQYGSIPRIQGLQWVP